MKLNTGDLITVTKDGHAATFKIVWLSRTLNRILIAHVMTPKEGDVDDLPLLQQAP
jgi:hypothetical protein